MFRTSDAKPTMIPRPLIHLRGRNNRDYNNTPAPR